MSETESYELKFKNSPADWASRAVIFAIFLFFGGRKFEPGANASWIELYNEIGFGQWFRYMTGIIELIGTLLLLFSQTVTVGLALLATTMVGAVLVDVIVLRRYADAFIPFAILCAMIALWLRRG